MVYVFENGCSYSLYKVTGRKELQKKNLRIEIEYDEKDNGVSSKFCVNSQFTTSNIISVLVQSQFYTSF